MIVLLAAVGTSRRERNWPSGTGWHKEKYLATPMLISTLRFYSCFWPFGGGRVFVFFLLNGEFSLYIPFNLKFFICYSWMREAYAHHGTCVEGRGQLFRARSLFLSFCSFVEIKLRWPDLHSKCLIGWTILQALLHMFLIYISYHTSSTFLVFSSSQWLDFVLFMSTWIWACAIRVASDCW